MRELTLRPGPDGVSAPAVPWRSAEGLSANDDLMTTNLTIGRVSLWESQSLPPSGSWAARLPDGEADSYLPKPRIAGTATRQKGEEDEAG